MIDGGPSPRMGRLTGRRSGYGSEAPQYQSEETSAQQQQPAQTSQPAEQQASRTVEESRKNANRPPKSGSSWVKKLIMLLALVAISVIGWLAWSNMSVANDDLIEADKYQAVFLSNGQIYFGNLESHDNRYMKLTNVFYLERQLSAGGEEQAELPDSDNNFQLLKYSDVLYGSEDLMVISRDDIIRYENLDPNGVVARAIAERN